MKAKMKCEFCNKSLIRSTQNQKFCPQPAPCKDSFETKKRQKHNKELLRDIRKVIAGHRSIYTLKTDSSADKKIIRATFKKAGFIY